MGQSLINVQFGTGILWTDTSDTTFSSEQSSWKSDRYLRTSLEDYADAHYWTDDILSFTPPQYAMEHPTGGLCKLTFGEIELSLNVFTGQKTSGNSIWTNTEDVEWAAPGSVDSPWVIEALSSGDAEMWPPPREISVTHKFTETDESGLTILFDGTGYLASFDRESVRYDLYGKKYDMMLLREVEDYDGNTVPLPFAIGYVEYRKVVRLPDSDGYPTYHHGWLRGDLGAFWHVFDDGVNIDTNVVDNGDETFSLTVLPVGEVTVSGTGDIAATLHGLALWACSECRFIEGIKDGLGLNIGRFPDTSLETIRSISHWADNQMLLIDFISQVAAYFQHLLYISGNSLRIVGMDKDNDERELTEYDFFGASYSYNSPISILKAVIKTRKPVEESIGVYVKDGEIEITVKSDYSYGEQETIDIYNSALADVTEDLESIIAYRHMAQVELQIPITTNLPAPGEKIRFTDESNFNQALTCTMHCRTIRYDPANDTISIYGDGELS